MTTEAKFGPEQVEGEQAKDNFQKLEAKIIKILEEKEDLNDNDLAIFRLVAEAVKKWPDQIKKSFEGFVSWQKEAGREVKLWDYLKATSVGRWQHDYPHNLFICFQGAETAKPDSLKIASNGRMTADCATVAGLFSPADKEESRVNNFLSVGAAEEMLRSLGVIGAKKQGLPETWSDLLYEQLMRQRWDPKVKGYPEELLYVKEAIAKDPESFNINFQVATNLPGISVHYSNDRVGIGRRFLALEIDESQKTSTELLEGVVLK